MSIPQQRIPNLLKSALLQHPALWRGRQFAATGPVLASGHPTLDAELPGGGFALGTLTELLLPSFGCSELSFALPMLRTQSQAGMKLGLVNPPHPPNATALTRAGVVIEQLLILQPQNTTDAAWACEQLLRSGACGLLLWWSENACERTLKRLQLAAEGGQSLAIVCRPLKAQHEISPAAVRLCLTLTAQGAALDILKCRGRNAVMKRCHLGRFEPGIPSNLRTHNPLNA